ncbi:four helix bundle protein [Niastella koreensis]|uniref:CHP02436-containing protein n=2 Tax=Niastella koreensis TaxID=354356 RepID=G8TH92_NIAKG|nr:four helix bundle protein [Niastella koreensis]AEW01702.1 CHP02436-containing protein [Niastella koreensis GR20-10]OQP48412.1 four helix bundle protein [Niastella koreensis]
MQKELLETNPIVKLSFNFSLKLVQYCEQLENARKFIIMNQLLRDGTSIGANVLEARNPESRADFIHKMKVAAKEADEAQYWLMLCENSESYPDCKELIIKLDEIQKILTKIIASTRRK